MSNGKPLDRIEVDILAVATSKPRRGFEIMRELQGDDRYPDEIPHSRIYYRLDNLIEKELVVKREYAADDRSHLYVASEAGERRVREYRDFLDDRLPNDAYVP